MKEHSKEETETKNRPEMYRKQKVKFRHRSISITILNVNGLSNMITMQRLSALINKHGPTICGL